MNVVLGATLDRDKSIAQINQSLQDLKVKDIKVSLSLDDNNAVNQLNSKLKDLEKTFTSLTNSTKQVSTSINGTFKDSSVEIDKSTQSTKKYNTELDNTKTKAKETSSEIKKAFNQSNLDLGKSTLSDRITTWMNNNTKATKEFGNELNDLQIKILAVDSQAGLTNLSKEFQSIRAESNALGISGNTAFGELADNAQKFFSWFTVGGLVAGGVGSLKEMVSVVIELDTAMTDLKKVTDYSDNTYSKLFEDAKLRAQEYGATLSDVIQATSDYSKLGFNVQDASTLADVSILYKNVGDNFSSISEASQSIISTMKAFNYEANNSIDIVDKFNAVSNQFAIDSKGIGDALQSSASSLASAGNDLDESIALITAMNTVLQNPNEVGNSLKVISMRLRNTKGALEELNIESDGAVESVTKLQTQLLNLTNGKVDIMLDTDTFKSTYDIMLEMSKVWDDITDVNKASIIELIAGKQRGNAVESLLQNMATAQEVVEASANSAGSALEENEKYLDSIEGKMAKFQSQFQSLASSSIDSNVVKELVDGATSLLGILEQIVKVLGNVPVLLGGITAFANQKTGLFKLDIDDGKLKVSSGLFKELKTNIDADVEALTKFQNGYHSANDKVAFSNTVLKEASDTAKNYSEKLVDGTGSVEDFAKSQQQATDSLTGLGVSLDTAKIKAVALNAVMSVGVMVAVTATVTALSKAYEYLSTMQERAIETGQELTNNYSEQASVLDGNISSLSGLEEEFNQLSSGVNSYGENIGLTTSEYERYKEIIEQIRAISPDLVAGYISEGNSLANKNDILKEAIKLQTDLKQQEVDNLSYQSDDVFNGLNAELEKLKTESFKLGNGNGKGIEFLNVLDEQVGSSKEKLEQLNEIFASFGVDIPNNDVFELFYGDVDLSQIQKIADNKEQIIALINEEFNLTQEQTAELTKQLGILEIELNKVDQLKSQYVDMLYTMAQSTQNMDWFSQIPDEFKDEFKTALGDIVNDPDLMGDANAMALAMQELGESFGEISAQLPTEEIKALTTSFDEGKISQQEYSDALQKHIDELRTLAETYRETNPELATFLDSITQGYVDLQEASTQVNQLTENYQLFANALRGISQDGEVDIGMTALYERLDVLKNQFAEGEIASNAYFEALNSELSSIDTSGLASVSEEMDKLNASLFVDSVKESAQGLSDLISQFDDGAISISEYLDGYTEIATTASMLTDILQANADAWTEEGYVASTELDNIQNSLTNSIATIDSYKDSIYSISQILSGAVAEGSNEFTAHTQVIAQDLMNIVNTSGAMAEQIKANMGTTTEEIANSLTGSVSNQQLAAQAIAQNTNNAIADMADAVGKLFNSLGEAISNFKVEMLFSASIEAGQEIDILGAKFNVPQVKFTLAPTGSMKENLSSIGASVSSFGNELKDHINSQQIALEDFYNVASDSYNPSSATVDNYNNSLKNLTGTTKGATSAQNDYNTALKNGQSSINSLISMTESMLKQKYADQKKGLQDQLKGIQTAYNAEKTAENDLYKQQKKALDAEKKALANQNKARQKAYNQAKKANSEALKALKDQYDAQVKIINAETDAYSKRIKLQKELLTLKDEERSYARELADANKSVADIENQLLSIQFDTSESANKKRRELQAQLEEAKLNLEDTQYDRNLQLTQDALDKELESFKAVQENKIELLTRQYDYQKSIYDSQMENLTAEYDAWKEYYEAQNELISARQEALSEAHQARLDQMQAEYDASKSNLDKQISDIDEYTSKEINIRNEAIKLIEKGGQEFQDQLIAWNLEYGDHTVATVIKTWNDAYSALKTFGGEQINVQSALENIVSQLNGLPSTIDQATKAMKSLADASSKVEVPDVGKGNRSDINATTNKKHSNFLHDGGFVKFNNEMGIPFKGKKPNEVTTTLEHGELVLSKNKTASDFNRIAEYLNDEVPMSVLMGSNGSASYSNSYGNKSLASVESMKNGSNMFGGNNIQMDIEYKIDQVNSTVDLEKALKTNNDDLYKRMVEANKIFGQGINTKGRAW